MLNIPSAPGGDNNVAVIMGVYEPKVQCRGDFAFPKSCRDVVGDMPASTDLEIFGPRDAPSVMVALPLEIHSGKAPRSCTDSSSRLTISKRRRKVRVETVHHRQV